MNKSRLTLILIVLSQTIWAQSTMPITTDSEDARIAFQQARDVLSTAWVTGGVEQMEQVLSLDSTLALAHVYLGISYAFLDKDVNGPFAAARRHAKQATEGEQWMIERWIYLLKGNKDSCAYAFEQVIHLHPQIKLHTNMFDARKIGMQNG